METKPVSLDGKRMEPDTNDCCFDGFEDSPTCKPKREFTCVHGRTLKRAAARRALSLDPLLTYECRGNDKGKDRHVSHEINDLGIETVCKQCGKPSFRLPFELVKMMKQVRFRDISAFHLSS